MPRNIITAALIIACSLVGAMAQAPAQSAAQPGAFDQRLGDDDGAAAAILFNTDLRGFLDLCDCNPPRGGLPRRIGYIEGFKKRFKATPVILVEGGNFYYQSTGFPQHVLLQNEQVSRAYSRWPVDVINLARYDLIYAQRLLAREGLQERTAQFPMIKNLVSANARLASDLAAPSPYIIKEITGPRIKSRKKLRVGFVGLVEPSRSGAVNGDGLITNMFETARQIIPRLRSRCDVLVIIAYAEMGSAERLAKENPEADIVIASGAGGIFKPRQIGNTSVFSVMPGDSQQGDIRIYLDRAGRASFKFRAVDLDSAIPADSAATAFVNTALRERENFRNNH